MLLVDKPEDSSSHDMVDAVRRLTGIRRVGHGGTLDPFATGLLLILVGRATRFFDLLAPLEKEYLVSARFGAHSDTGDIRGRIEAVDGPEVSEQELLAILPKFTGIINQKPPAYSAIKQKGVPLYKLARRGEDVEASVRTVKIHDISMLAFDEEAQEAIFSVRCSKGTYIRTLCGDIGAALGTAAYAAALRRTAIGELRAERAATPGQLAALPANTLLDCDNTAFLSCLSALYFLPVRELDKDELRAVRHGQAIGGEGREPVRLVGDGRLVAVYGPADREGLIRPMVVLA